MIYKNNDSKKNMYTIFLETKDATPEEIEEITSFTKKKAFELVDCFLDAEREDVYRSQSIKEFLDNYYK
ncbi:MAG: hypothetical protein ACTSRI_13520 [Promethearchaeota archaeon]